MSSPAGIVTPEAVVLEFETAGVASRILAGLIDGAVQFGALVVLLVGIAGVGTSIGQLGGVAAALLYVSLFLILFGYPAALETLWRGRTLGKAALGLRVVTIEGAPIRFRHAAIRSILQLVDKLLFSGIVGVSALLVTSRNQRLGDLVAGTLVLRERTGARAPTAVSFGVPPELEPYVSTLDVSALAHHDYTTIRSFLLRASSLPSAIRTDLAHQVAAPLVDRLRTSPPRGMQAEWFLTCVATAFQRRSGPRASAGPGGREPRESVWSRADNPEHAGSGHQIAGHSRQLDDQNGGEGFVAPT